MNKRLVLASNSPRRRQMLALLGLEFEVVEPDIVETPGPVETPAELATRLAREKALSVQAKLGADVRVLGGDTVVSLDNAILGKPHDRDQAVSMLHQLSGCTHSVFSAVALADDQGCRDLMSESQVTFGVLDDRAIQLYCDSPDPYDKAGAYGIQGAAGTFVARLEGSYSGVMGFPLWQVHQLLMNSH